MTRKLLVYSALSLVFLISYNRSSAQIISQYVETNSGTVPKGLEIWNNTNAPLDFSTNNLLVQQGTNGAAAATIVTVNTGTLDIGNVMVIGTPEMGTYLTGQSNTSRFISFTFTFNGDDALVIKYGGATTDVFGTVGTDPGTAWVGGGVSTADQNIQLKTGITTGALTGFSDPSIRFSTVSVTPATLPAGLTGFGVAPQSSATDMFRTRQSGNWTATSTWESSSNGTAWSSPATLTPTQTSDTVIIRDNHTVTVNTSVTTDETSVLSLGELVVTSPGLLTVANGGFLTLKSSVLGTARLGTSTGSVTGNVTVERFIGAPSAKRAWRLLTAPFSTANTIQASWQNGQVYTAGIGTFITGSGTGLDAGNASMKAYNTASQALIDVTNTTVDIASQPGYFIFIRGDRNTNNLTSPNTNTTTLSATGTIRTGDQSSTTSATNNAYTLLGNPYASQVDFDVFRQQNAGANIRPNLYYWDANAAGANGVGAYGIASWNGTSYDYTGAATVNTTIIPSGSAFFVQTLADQTGTTASVTFKEGQKTSAAVTNLLRVGTQTEKLDIKLQSEDATSTMNVVDGVLARFNNTYSTQVGNEDAGKLMNLGENLSLARSGSLLVIEGRPLVDIDDTLFLQLSNMKVGTNYQFVLTTTNFSAPLLDAYLVDRFTGTSTALNLSGSTTVSFTVSSTAASTGNRFIIVFRQSGVLPVNYTTVKAYQKNNGIQVDWKVAAENNIRNYEVENSVDGRNFTKAGAVAAKSNNNLAATYAWFDASPVRGVNYYRIKAIDNSGVIKYSQVVSVKLGGGKSEVSIYPNPVTGNTISLQFNNKEAGSYVVQLFNNIGQQVYNKSITHQGGSSSQTLNLGSAVSKGVYQLQVSGGDTKMAQQIIIK